MLTQKTSEQTPWKYIQWTQHDLLCKGEEI